MPGQRARLIPVPGQLHDERADALGVRLEVEQHPAHVGVLDDRDPGRRRVLPVREVRALLAVPRVLHRVLVRGRRRRQALDADRDARAVHHPEHLGHAQVLDGADQLALAAVVLAEVEDRGRRAVDAHLVLDGADR